MCNAAVSRDHSSMLNNKIREWICGVIVSSDPRLGERGLSIVPDCKCLFIEALIHIV